VAHGRQLVHSLILATGLVIAAAGCADGPTPVEFAECDSFRIDFVVRPVDALTDVAVIRGITVVIVGPVGVDSITVDPAASDLAVNAMAASGFTPSAAGVRTGLYAVRVRHAEYQAWMSDIIRLRVEGCKALLDDGPIVARLERLESPA
jgi:hypothetical protein